MNVVQLGAACKRWRLERTNYPQEHFAKLAGVTISAVSQFERGSGGVGSLRIYCAYLSCGFRLPKGSAAEAYANYLLGGGDVGKKRNR